MVFETTSDYLETKAYPFLLFNSATLGTLVCY
jgi:hypothetical protein